MKKSNVLQELTRTPMSGVWSFSHGLSSHTLKIIAIMTMLIDHIAAVLMEGETGYWLLREIGRISFPIFCFLAAEGIAWTSNIFKYALRLGAFALIWRSIVPSGIPCTRMCSSHSFWELWQVVCYGRSDRGSAKRNAPGSLRCAVCLPFCVV